jgi:hypothetical protein
MNVSNGITSESLSKNTWLMVSSRIAMLIASILLPVALSLGAYIGNRAITNLDKINERVTKLIGTLDTVTMKNAYEDSIIADHEVRIRTLESHDRGREDRKRDRSRDNSGG